MPGRAQRGGEGSAVHGGAAAARGPALINALGATGTDWEHLSLTGIHWERLSVHWEGLGMTRLGFGEVFKLLLSHGRCWSCRGHPSGHLGGSVVTLEWSVVTPTPTWARASSSSCAMTSLSASGISGLSVSPGGHREGQRSLEPPKSRDFPPKSREFAHPAGGTLARAGPRSAARCCGGS